mgnify:CR=1 FL=1
MKISTSIFFIVSFYFFSAFLYTEEFIEEDYKGNIDIWDKIKKQSERQLGAYYFTWYITTGTMPKIRLKKLKIFRVKTKKNLRMLRKFVRKL